MLKQNDYQTSYVKNLGELIKLKILKLYKILGYKWYSFEFSYKVLQYNMVYNTLLSKIKTLTLVDH